jgi:type IV secretory pathway component VirB8
VDACGDVYVRHRFGYSAVQLPDDCDIVLPAALVSAEVEQLHANAIVEQHLRYQASNLRSRTQAIENALVATRNTLAAVRQIKGSES